MRFSPTLRSPSGKSGSRSSPLIFKRNKKGASVKKAQVPLKPQTEEVLEQKQPVDETQPNIKQSVEKISEKEAPEGSFPDITGDADAKEEITADARENDQSDCSIQTEKREELESLDSIRTEYEPPEEEGKEEVSCKDEVTDGLKDEARCDDGGADGMKEEATCKDEGTGGVHEPNSSSEEQTKEEGKMFTMNKSVDRCKASLATGLEPPNFEKPLAAVRECQDSLCTYSRLYEMYPHQQAEHLDGMKEEATCKDEGTGGVHEPNSSSEEQTKEEGKMFTMNKSVDGCKASLATGLEPPNFEKPLAAVRECQDSLSQRFEKVRPGLQVSLAKVNEIAGDMRTSLAGVSAKVSTQVSTRAGGVAKGVSQSVERFVCGDEHALKHAAQQQEQIVSPKQQAPATATTEGTNAVLRKYTLHRLLCGDYKCSDCVSDLAVGAVDIICMGYCDGDNSKDIIKADTNGEFDDIFSFKTDALSPENALISPNTAFMGSGTFGDETAQAFTFDSADSTYTEGTPSLNLDKVALVTENRRLMLESIELTEADFFKVKDVPETPSALTPLIKNNKKITHWAEGVTPKSVRGVKGSLFSPKAAGDNERVAIELLMSDLPPTKATEKKNTRRKSLFRREVKDMPKENAGYTVQTIIEDTKTSVEKKVLMSGSDTENPGIAPSASGSTAKSGIVPSASGSSGEGSAQNTIRMTVTVKSFRRPKQGAKEKVSSRGGATDKQSNSGGSEAASIQQNVTQDGQQSMFSF